MVRRRLERPLMHEEAEVSENTFDSSVKRLPRQTVTLEEYKARGGLPLLSADELNRGPTVRNTLAKMGLAHTLDDEIPVELIDVPNEQDAGSQEMGKSAETAE